MAVVVPMTAVANAPAGPGPISPEMRETPTLQDQQFAANVVLEPRGSADDDAKLPSTETDINAETMKHKKTPDGQVVLGAHTERPFSFCICTLFTR